MKNFNSICFKNNKKLSSFFIITILLSTLISTIKCSSFCDFCQCYDDRASSLFIENDDIDEMFHVVNCNGEQLINKNALTTSYKMQTLEWPLTEKRIIGYFNHLNLTVLPKLEHAPSNKVIVLNFDDNLIETIGTKPFQYFENLVEISLRNNFISDLPKDLLYGLRKLDHLNLSNNSITFVREDFIPDSLQLKSIDLSHNSIKSLSSDIIQGLQTVEQINLNHNEIYVIKSGGSQGKTKWQNLNLSGNKLKVLTDLSLIDFPELTKLDLSHNGLVNIERDTFVNLSLLEKLDLSANELHGVVMKLPESLDKLKLGNNSLRLWPLEHTPKNLRYLDVHGNELTEIFNGQDVVPHLKVLNISRNVIDIFPLINFTHLSILDLSYNAFTEVPKHLPKYAPFLEELIMDNNPLSSLKLGERMRLSKLSFKNMPFIESIDAFTFSNVEGAKVRRDGSSTCVDIYVSHCDKLESVSDDAFLGVHLCYLDLSYNQIKKLPNNLTEWHRLEDGINLQGNPLHCDCESQWMIDDILNHLYAHTKHQHLLNELRCHGPNFTNQRFVRFYNRLNPFCDPKVIPMNGRMEQYQMENEYSSKVHTAGMTKIFPPYIIIIVSCIIVLFLIIISGIYLTRIQDKKMAARNRRYFAT